MNNYATQPTIEAIPMATQPKASSMMNAAQAPPAKAEQTDDPLRIRGGCPGKFCGLPILPCRCDICIIPIPCC